MIKKIKNIIVSALAAAALFTPMALPAIAHAATNDLQGSLSCGTDLNVTGTGCSPDAGAETKVNDTVKLGLNLFSAIVGIISVVMIIVGGIRYITSGGDSGKVSAAQNTVLYAVIGLVVVALAQIIVQFVLKKFTTG